MRIFSGRASEPAATARAAQTGIDIDAQIAAVEEVLDIQRDTLRTANGQLALMLGPDMVRIYQRRIAGLQAALASLRKLQAGAPPERAAS